MRLSVARCSARASAPLGGIFVSSSHESTRLLHVMDLGETPLEVFEAIGQGGSEGSEAAR